jgi:anthranilate phosphoribosyltransferase
MSGVKRCVAAFATGGKVTAEETEAALTDIMAGAATPSQVGAFLLGE